MRDVYFHSIFYQNRGEKIDKPIRKDLVIASESLGGILMNERDYVPINQMPYIEKPGIDLQRTINSPIGIFYYESDLWDKKELKNQLLKLIEEVLDD